MANYLCPTDKILYKSVSHCGGDRSLDRMRSDSDISGVQFIKSDNLPNKTFCRKTTVVHVLQYAYFLNLFDILNLKKKREKSNV